MNVNLLRQAVSATTALGLRRSAVAASAWLAIGWCSLASAQQVADPGFKSVGRGAPLAASVQDFPRPAHMPPTTADIKQIMETVARLPFVGPMRLPPPPGTPANPDLPESIDIMAASEGAVPKGIKPLPIDIFTSKDFYKDRALWTDPRYFRCNSPRALEVQRGAIFGTTIGKDPPRTAAWGYCDRDYPRKAIVSPYPFKTAQAHYEALLAETHKRGGPTQHTYATVPGELNGWYAPGGFPDNWYAMELWNQIPTVLSLLTPEYQTRMVQQAYHQANTNVPQWPSQYCWPEGFMRRWHSAATSFRSR